MTHPESPYGVTRRQVLRLSATAAAVGATPFVPDLLSATHAHADEGTATLAPNFQGWDDDTWRFYMDGRIDLDRFLEFDHTNADLQFHRSFVPRAKRVSVATDLQAQPAIDPRPQVADFSEFYAPIVSRPQGFKYAHEFRYGLARDIHVTRFQQYRDLVSYWQVFTAVPNAALTDVVHRNGGKCIAFMFNSDATEFDREHLLRQDSDGEFVVGNKLVDMCLYFGFDGYMFDMEAGLIDSADKPLIFDMFRAMHARAREGGLDLHLQIYGPNHDRRRYDDWQSISDEHADYLTTPDVADSWFLDYSWSSYLDRTRSTLANQADLDPYSQVFFGIELEGYRESIGVDTTRSDLPEVIPPNGSGEPVGGTALFSLTAETGRIVHNELKAANGGVLPDFETVRKAMYEGERRFWSGASQNPAIADDHNGDIGRHGMADYASARSAITSLPFITRFNTGAADVFALDGTIRSTEPWYNLGIQDHLPTWQFWTRDLNTGEPTTGPLSLDYDLTSGYDGGSSLVITGTPDPANPTEIRLYRTELELPTSSQLALSYRTPADRTHLSIGLIFDDDHDTTEWFAIDDLKPNDDFGPTWGLGAGGNGWSRGGWVPDSDWATGWSTTRAGTDWKQAVIGLGDHAGRTVAAITLAVQAAKAEEYRISLGELAITANELQAGTPAKPAGLTVAKSVVRPDGTGAEARLHWQFDPRVWYYDITRTNPEGDDIWLGRVTADRYYLERVPKLGSETTATLHLTAVAPNGRRSAPAGVQVTVA